MKITFTLDEDMKTIGLISGNNIHADKMETEITVNSSGLET